MNILLTGKFIGVYQEDSLFFARFKSAECPEIDIPVTSEQFHKIKLDTIVKIHVQQVV